MIQGTWNIPETDNYAWIFLYNREQKRMLMQMEDLQNKMKDIQFMKVTREIQLVSLASHLYMSTIFFKFFKHALYLNHASYISKKIFKLLKEILKNDSVFVSYASQILKEM